MKRIVSVLLIALVGAGVIAPLIALAMWPVPEGISPFNEPEAMMDVFEMTLSLIEEEKGKH